MKILWRGYASGLHSWSIVAQSITRELIKKGHDVHIFSTNGAEHIPEDLAPYFIGNVSENNQILNGRIPDAVYDAQLSYTALKNFPNYFSNGNKNKFGIWCFEWAHMYGKNILPDGFAKNYKYVDKLFPPSNFAKQIFLDAGIPENSMQVLPHGINPEQINSAQPYQLKTKKSTKIFVNIAQVHSRKNIPNLMEAFGKAFTNKDDICLVLKVQDNSKKHVFELSYQDILKNFKNKYKNHAEIELVKEFVPNIYSLYKACDISFSMSHCEGFGMTALEAAATGLINVNPRYGGFLDFTNNDNSFLIEGKIVKADQKSMYWSQNPYAVWFEPSIDDAVDKLKYIEKNKDNLSVKAKEHSKYILENYSWKKVVEQINFEV